MIVLENGISKFVAYSDLHGNFAFDNLNPVVYTTIFYKIDDSIDTLAAKKYFRPMRNIIS